MKDSYCCEWHPDVFIPTKFHHCDLCVDEFLVRHGLRCEVNPVVEFLNDEDFIELDELYSEPKR